MNYKINQKLKCVTIDDETASNEIVNRYIRQTSTLELFDTFTNSQQAIGFIGDNLREIDVLILDISMPDYNGIDFIKLFSQEVNIIISSGWSRPKNWEYDINIIDYLHKPYSYLSFLNSINLVFSQINHSIITSTQTEFFQS